MQKRKKRNYVNNPDFLEALILHKKNCQDARDASKQLPVVPNYLGECIYHISNRLSSKPNFSGYSFREDMVMDGIENSLLYIENFDAAKSSNPFAYFTQIIWFAFLRRIAKEKKFLYTKLKSSQALLAMGETHVGGSEIGLNLSLDADYIDTFIGDFEDKLARDKAKAKKREE
jgi:hypothetical protein